MIRKSILIWLSFIPLAIINAGIREKIATPLIGAACSLPLSGMTLIALMSAVSYACIPKLGEGTPETYRRMGFLWMFLTALFETGMGFFTGNTWREIALSYDVTTGNLWLLVLLFTGCLPRLVSLLRRHPDST